jgi:hypothetical protein
MARNPLIDTEYVPTQPIGRDSASLGPSDSSDSGSDVADIAPDDGAASDSGGTGERRGAAGEASLPDAADIGVDRVFEPESAEPDAAEPPQPDPPQRQSARQRRRDAQRGGRPLSGGTRRR